MGLSITTGVLADIEDDDYRDALSDAFRVINDCLVRHGLPIHNEPTECDMFSADMFGYEGLHYLRRLAAHLDCGRTLPAPGCDEDFPDECVEAYIASLDPSDERYEASRKAFPFRHEFNHLILPSDTEGIYVPVDFSELLLPEEDLPLLGGYVCSSVQLLRELDRLAAALDIPDEIDETYEGLFELAQSPRLDGRLWERYAFETYNLVVLRDGCRESIGTGAALIFE